MTFRAVVKNTMLSVVVCQCLFGYCLLAADGALAQPKKTYAERLVATKRYYPFNIKWKKNYQAGLKQYSAQNREQAEAIADKLIDGLIALGEKAAETQKLALFKGATQALNRLNEYTGHSLIETEEREELVALFNKIAIAAHIDYRKYGHGEGPASEWRDW